MRRKKFIVCFLLLFSTNYAPPVAAEDKVDRAVEWLKTVCVTGGHLTDLKVSGNGGIKMRSISQAGISGSFVLHHKELEGFIDQATAVSVKEAEQVRTCMKPYIGRILDIILSDKN